MLRPNILDSQCRKSSWGTLLYFKESQHAKKLMHKGGIMILPKNNMDKKVRGRECHNFPSKNCCLTVPKNFVGELFCVPDNFL